MARCKLQLIIIINRNERRMSFGHFFPYVVNDALNTPETFEKCLKISQRKIPSLKKTERKWMSATCVLEANCLEHQATQLHYTLLSSNQTLYRSSKSINKMSHFRSEGTNEWDIHGLLPTSQFSIELKFSVDFDRLETHERMENKSIQTKLFTHETVTWNFHYRKKIQCVVCHKTMNNQWH